MASPLPLCMSTPAIDLSYLASLISDRWGSSSERRCGDSAINCRLPGQSDGAQAAFVQRWLWSHWNDARNILKKPLVFSEFGKSKKDPGYSPNGRDWYFNGIYRNIYGMARNGGTIGGGLVWQLMAGGMEDYYDGYEIVLSEDPVITGLITRQSHSMSALAHTLSHPNTMVSGGGGSQVNEQYTPKTITR